MSHEHKRPSTCKKRAPNLDCRRRSPISGLNRNCSVCKSTSVTFSPSIRPGRHLITRRLPRLLCKKRTTLFLCIWRCSCSKQDSSKQPWLGFELSTTTVYQEQPSEGSITAWWWRVPPLLS